MTGPKTAARSGLFRALRHHNYRLWFFGQMVSLVGTWMQTIAQQWLIYRLTGSATMLGVVSLIPLLPLLPLSIWAGSIADRWPKRDILVATQVLMMAQAFVLAALVVTDTIQVWHVLVLALFLGAAQAVDTPARQSFVVELVDDRADLTNAISLNSTIFNTGRAVGPAIAGLAVATAGEGGAFLINGISFIAVIAALMLMRIPKMDPPVEAPQALAHMREGFSYVATNQPVLVLMSMVAVSAFLAMPYTTLLPVFAKDVLAESAAPILDALCTGGSAILSCQAPDAVSYGLLMAASGLGAVTGALIMASLPASAPRGRWLTAGNLLFPIILVGVAVSRSFWFTSLLLFAAGLAFVAQNVLVNTLIQITVGDKFRGRVMSVYSLAFQGMMRLGSMQAGFMGDLFGAPFSVAIGAALSLIYGISVAIRYPSVRRLK